MVSDDVKPPSPLKRGEMWDSIIKIGESMREIKIHFYISFNRMFRADITTRQNQMCLL